jgi:hypothetical protein
LAHVNFNHLKFVQHGFALLSTEPLGSKGKGKNKGGSSILIQVKQRASAASDPAPTRAAA